MSEYFFVFVIGGTVATLVTYFENTGWPILSRLAALFPVATWVSYIFIGRISGSQAVSRHALFVLLGTIAAWIPYMLAIYYLSPKIGSGKAIASGIVLFVLLALIFIRITKNYIL